MIRRFLMGLTLPVLALALGSTAFAATDYRVVPTIPLQGDHVRTARPTIAFQIHSGEAQATVPQSAIRLFVDDVEVTAQLAVEGANLAYVPTQPLAFGDHDVRVSVDDGSGGAIGYSWKFTIDADDVPSQADVAPLESEPYGTLTPLANQYGYGDDAGFLFSGAPGGSGYLTFAGFPGIYPLIPFYGNLYYAAFPVPWGFYSNAPGVIAHFCGPGGHWGAFEPSRPIVFVPNPADPHRRYPEAPHGGYAGNPGPTFSGNPVSVRSTAPTIVRGGSNGTDGPHILRFSSPVNGNAGHTTITTVTPTTTTTVVPSVATPNVPTTVRGYVVPGEHRGVEPIVSRFSNGNGYAPGAYRTISPSTAVTLPANGATLAPNRPALSAPPVRAATPVYRSAPPAVRAAPATTTQSRSTR